ncbi:MAG TPA: hypothetical protein VII94_00200 [Candidatus Saccharimonadales bacterium]
MIESFKEITAAEVKDTADLDRLLQEKVGVSFLDCAKALEASLQDRAAELAPDFPNIAPNGDYSVLIEDQEAITTFLRDVAAKAENWHWEMMEIKSEKDQLLEMVFFNTAVDDGDFLKGFVFLGLSGKIRHAFAQVR